MRINGYPVVDSKKKVVLTVTPLDVKKGRVKSPDACAVAIACVRQLGCKQAVVHATRTYLRIDMKWTRYFSPAAIKNELIAFDRGGKFEPGKYTLEPIPQSQREGEYAKRGYEANKSRRRISRKNHMTPNIRSHQGWNSRVTMSRG